MKLMCRIYVVKEHKEVEFYYGSEETISERTLFEERCYSETDDELEMGHAVYKEIGREMSIDTLYHVRETLAKGEKYSIVSWFLGKSDPLNSLFDVTYENGKELDKARQYIYLEKEWTIEK